MRINFALAGQLTVVSIVFFFAWRAFRNWANRTPATPTVEQEEAKAREVAAHAPQWNGVTVTVPETHEYSAFDLDDSTNEAVSEFSGRHRGARR